MAASGDTVLWWNFTKTSRKALTLRRIQAMCLFFFSSKSPFLKNKSAFFENINEIELHDFWHIATHGHAVKPLKQ